jgi:flagellar biosynthesis protein FlhG
LTEAAHDPRARPRIVTVGGGRGGIGKSTAAAQLAWAAAQMGKRVLLVDADLAAPSLHLLLGAGSPQGGLATLMGRDNRSGSLITVPTHHPQLQLVAGGGRNQLRPEAVTPAARLRLFERLRGLDAELAFVDVGAGLGYDAVDLLELGDQRIVVATTATASLNEGFALTKEMVGRTLRRHLQRARQLGLLEPAVRTPEGERVSDVLRRVNALDPELAARITLSLDHLGTFLFGNQMQDLSQLSALQGAIKTALDYLSVPLTLLGWLRAGAQLPGLATLEDPEAAADQDEGGLFRQLVSELLAGPVARNGLLLDELASAVPDRRTTPPPLPVEAIRQADSRPTNGKPAEPRKPAESTRTVEAARAAAAAAADDEGEEIDPFEDTPVPPPRKKPLVYVRPPRRRRARAAAPASEPGAPEGQKPRRRAVPLPGMPPRRLRK